MFTTRLKSRICSYKLRKKHNITKKSNLLPAQSILIPCTGEDYVEEAVLAAQFASENATHAEEIIIVTDQHIPSNLSFGLAKNIRCAHFDPSPHTPNQHTYTKIYRSRICKLSAPNFARFERILMIDSDLMLLKEPQLPWHEWGVTGSFRKGKMITKFKRSGARKMPEPLKKTCRPYIEDHLNGAFLAANNLVWNQLTQLWLSYYQTIWDELPDNQPPTDQLPLTCALDHLQLTTINAGDDINWPVSKKIGGQQLRIPSSVIGAHGGLPLSEWKKYRSDRNAILTFSDSKTTRRVRYQTNPEEIAE